MIQLSLIRLVFVAGLITVLLGSLFCGTSAAYEIDGDMVYIDDKHSYMSVSPHHIFGDGDYTRFTNMYFNEDTGLPEFEVEA